ncbi:AI-2E family transporter [Halobellus sp. GM3]|uniref:AI-2E family transporter n=1 Tax=Halobellus sp. GM3 TaxID=3458410 RepID=UPI00403DD620
MSESPIPPASDRNRLGWWLFVALLGLAAAYIVAQFVGLLSLAAFGYYATRPICRTFARVTDSDSLAAGVTVVVVLLPIIGLALYVGVRIAQTVQRELDDSGGVVEIIRPYVDLDAVPAEQREALLQTLSNPGQALDPATGLNGLVDVGLAAFSAVAGTALFLGLAVSLSFFLLANDDDIAAALGGLFGGRDTAAYAYATAVDGDLESVFFGNLLFVIAMAGLSIVVYGGTNLLAPEGLRVPMVFVLAFLTGVASLIPIIVGKIVYLPVVGYLAVQAISTDGASLTFVALVLVAYVLVLDILPQTFLQPYLSGQRLDMMLLMFGYILGPVLFGWYGFFLLPILFVVMLEAVRIVLPQLLHGEALTPAASMGDSIGTDPRSGREATADGSTNGGRSAHEEASTHGETSDNEERSTNGG